MYCSQRLGDGDMTRGMTIPDCIVMGTIDLVDLWSSV